MAQTPQRSLITQYSDGQVVISKIRKKRNTIPIFGANEEYSATLVTSWYDGSPMDDTKADGSVYFKLKALPQGADPDIYGQYVGSYFRVNLPKFGETFLEKDTMQDMRDLSPVEVLLLKMGYYKGVKLNGYYDKNDTPAPIEYYLSETADLDDGGSVIVVGDVKLEHVFAKRVSTSYFGGVGDGIHSTSTAINNILLKYVDVFVPDGTHLITETISNYKTMSLTSYYSTSNYDKSNGISILGESKEGVIFVYDISTDDQYMLDLDGNKDNSGTLQNPASQIGNDIRNITFIKGETRNGYGVRLSANWECKFKYLRFKGIKKSFYLKGSTTPDSATSNLIRFEKIICSNGEVGIECSESRAGTIKIDSCEFRNMSNYGIDGTFATLSIESSQIVACGNNADNQTGGIRIRSGNTASQNRALTIQNCMFENNKWSDIYLRNIDGAVINGNAFHPYFTIPTLQGNEQCCVRIDGVATYGVKGVQLNGNRIQAMANPASGAEIVRFIKASGTQVRDIKVGALSAPEDSHLQYLFDIGSTVQNFYSASFGASGGWKIPQTVTVTPFTGDSSSVESRQSPLLENIVLDWDNSSGLDGTPQVVGSRFNAQKAYIVPWSGVYQVSVDCSLFGLDTAVHNSVRVDLIAGGVRKRIRRLETGSFITGNNMGSWGSTMKLSKGAEVYLVIQVTGTSKTVTVSELVSQYNSLALQITQIQ